ncbi:oxidoreductase [Paraflavitalea soli]|uniref:Oxidoreductase n=1 Tax=Paraflavitalea soli TaxID=2315862 RepID=A0A3B7MZ16_9BACT|nr:oxidoreductase [Paraflavitalea soli]
MTKSISVLFLLSCLFSGTTVQAQHIELLTSGTETSLRGLSVVNDAVIWVSGSKGKVGRSMDGGKTWIWTTVPGYEQRDFRDIEAFDEKTAVIIAIAEPANILKTTDGGKTWKTVFTDTTKGMFLDAMDFIDNKRGIVVGDPIDGKVYLATTDDGGSSWKKFTATTLPAMEGEGFFAASGTNIRYQKNGLFTIVSGGKVARLLDPQRTVTLDIIQGREMTGPNSIAINGNHAVIVAGDYDNQPDTTGNCLLSTDGMKTWHAPVTGPRAYRSCVAYITPEQLITCGVPGVDISIDGGNNWKLISPDGYHVCQKAKKGKAVYLAGGKGRIGKLVW